MNSTPAPDIPNPLAPFRAGYWFGGFNGLTWMIGLGTPMVLLAEQLGASAFQVGLASSFVISLYPVQVVATTLLPHLGYRRQMVFAWSARAMLLGVPLTLAWLAPATPEPWMPSALIASVFWFCTFRAFGVAAHIPWFAAILPDELRGRFFATDNAITSVVGVATLLTCALLFATLPAYRAFQAVYGLAAVGSALAVVNLLRLPAGPTPPHSPLNRVLGLATRLSLRAGLFRQYLVISLFWLVATLPIPAFGAYYLKVVTGLSSSQILLYTAVQFIGQIAAASRIRHLIDAIPIKRFFQLANGIVILVAIVWLAVIFVWIDSSWLLPAAYLLFGFAIGLSQAAHFTYLPELSPEDRRPVTIAIFGAVTGLLSGIAPMAWGVVLRTGGDVPGIDLDNFALFFGSCIAFSTIGIGLLNSLPDKRRGVSKASSDADERD